MALIPIGVAAPFIPSIFADIFIETNSFDSVLIVFLPNMRSISGESSFVNFFEMPVCSKILKKNKLMIQKKK